MNTDEEKYSEQHLRGDNAVTFDYSYVYSSARVAIYDDLLSTPRVITINPSVTNNFIESLADTIYNHAKQAGGSLPYTVIREVTENFIHAQFKEIVVSILDKGNTIRFADQGPGIIEKQKAQEPGFTSATQEMTAYIRGVGSGLPIVKEYMDGRNGSITIEDNLKEGAVITISLNTSQCNTSHDTSSHISPEYSSPKYKLSDREKSILLCIKQLGPSGVTDIVRELALPQTTVYSSLTKLEQIGLLEKGPGKKRSLTPEGYESL